MEQTDQNAGGGVRRIGMPLSMYHPGSLGRRGFNSYVLVSTMALRAEPPEAGIACLVEGVSPVGNLRFQLRL
jgi:hypothetical protein